KLLLAEPNAPFSVLNLRQQRPSLDVKELPDRHDRRRALSQVDRTKATGWLLELIDQHACVEQQPREVPERCLELESFGGHASGARVYNVDWREPVFVRKLDLGVVDRGPRPIHCLRESAARL